RGSIAAASRRGPACPRRRLRAGRLRRVARRQRCRGGWHGRAPADGRTDTAAGPGGGPAGPGIARGLSTLFGHVRGTAPLYDEADVVFSAGGVGPAQVVAIAPSAMIIEPLAPGHRLRTAAVFFCAQRMRRAPITL